MNIHTVETEIGGRTITFETGKLAKQASGAVTVRCGDTIVLCTVVSADPREGIDFFPLTVDYREKMYAAGRFPGGFFKREGRPTQKEILTMRLIDRPIRPLFPEGYMDEVQIQSMVMSADAEADPDVLAMCGASAALAISDIPFEGPTAAVRVCRINGELVLNPPHAQRAEADMEIVMAGHKEAVNMIEVGAKEVSEDVVAQGLALGHRAIQQICKAIDDLARKVGTPKEWEPPEADHTLAKRVKELAESRLRKAKKIVKKQERNDAVKEIYDEVIESLSPEGADEPEFERSAVKAALSKLEEKIVRDTILKDGIRPDGRKMDEIREISCEVGVLPRVHGSALFTRGETQALVALTLGTGKDEQIIDDLVAEYSKKFMLHYNFPPFSVGEVRKIGSPGRREIGHGALAERALEGVMPNAEEFPYTVRLVSDILESNGSSSMASVCGGTLALMDGGVPIVQPVAGISIGLVQEGDKSVLLTDIIGEEDHFGDMDFKVAGTPDGITAIQLDLKTRGLSHELIVETLERAREARMHILKQMLATIREPRPTTSPYAPYLVMIKIDPEKIGKVIGPGGASIKKIQALSGANVEIEDDGSVVISGVGHEGPNMAREMIEQITEGAKLGKIYTGKVISIKDFGAFVEISPGQDGLCHISELSTGYVNRVEEVCKIGDTMRVKVILIDDQGRVKLSRKAAIAEEGHNDELVGGEPSPGGDEREGRYDDEEDMAEVGANDDSYGNRRESDRHEGRGHGGGRHEGGHRGGFGDRGRSGGGYRGGRGGDGGHRGHHGGDRGHRGGGGGGDRGRGDRGDRGGRGGDRGRRD